MAVRNTGRRFFLDGIPEISKPTAKNAFFYAGKDVWIVSGPGFAGTIKYDTGATTKNYTYFTSQPNVGITVKYLSSTDTWEINRQGVRWTFESLTGFGRRYRATKGVDQWNNLVSIAYDTSGHATTIQCGGLNTPPDGNHTIQIVVDYVPTGLGPRQYEMEAIRLSIPILTLLISRRKTRQAPGS